MNESWWFKEHSITFVFLYIAIFSHHQVPKQDNHVLLFGSDSPPATQITTSLTMASALSRLDKFPVKPRIMWCMFCLECSVESFEPRSGKPLEINCFLDNHETSVCRACFGEGYSYCKPVSPFFVPQNSSSSASDTNQERRRLGYLVMRKIWQMFSSGWNLCFSVALTNIALRSWLQFSDFVLALLLRRRSIGNSTELASFVVMVMYVYLSTADTRAYSEPTANNPNSGNITTRFSLNAVSWSATARMAISNPCVCCLEMMGIWLLR